MSHQIPAEKQPYYLVVEPYLVGEAKAGDRGYLSEILQTWTPEIDPDYAIRWALHDAIFNGDDTAVLMILKAGVPPTLRQPMNLCYTPLLHASQHGRIGLVRMLWQLIGPEGRFYPYGRPRPKPTTCLHVAAQNGHADLMEFFLGV